MSGSDGLKTPASARGRGENRDDGFYVVFPFILCRITIINLSSLVYHERDIVPPIYLAS